MNVFFIQFLRYGFDSARPPWLSQCGAAVWLRFQWREFKSLLHRLTYTSKNFKFNSFISSIFVDQKKNKKKKPRTKTLTMKKVIYFKYMSNMQEVEV